MAAEVSSLFRVLRGYNDDQQHLSVGSESSGEKSTALITRDLLGGSSSSSKLSNESQELDLDLQVPNGWEKRLDLKVGQFSHLGFLCFLGINQTQKIIFHFCCSILDFNWVSFNSVVMMHNFCPWWFNCFLAVFGFCFLLLNYLFWNFLLCCVLWLLRKRGTEDVKVCSFLCFNSHNNIGNLTQTLFLLIQSSLFSEH